MYYANPDVDLILQTADQLELQAQESLLLLFGEECSIDYPLLIERLNAAGLSFFGGIFPSVIFGEKNDVKGCIVKKLPLLQKPLLVRGLDREDFDSSVLAQLNTQFGTAKLTVLTFVDGLCANIARYLNKMYHNFGNEVNFLGGGAGSLSLQQQPCILCNDGLFQDAAVICAVAMEVSLSVKHGWQKMMGPLVATRTSKNVIHELNWTDAFEVYKGAIKDYADQEISKNNFFDIAKSFPFGIFKENQEDVVRDPIAVSDNGDLICVGEVPENTVLYILKGEPAALIDSARSAIRECVDAARYPIAHTLVVDCISRTLFLEQEFSKELKAVNRFLQPTNDEAIPQGVLSLGEISSNGNGFLEFYNKTLVIGALQEH
ncbi:MAG: FIST C-terminal domain-containing protein [Bacteroidota bacterium]